MIKLKYREMNINGLVVQYAKYRKNRNIRLSISDDSTIKVTYPYYITEPEIFNFVASKEDWIRKSLRKIKNKDSLQKKPKLNKSELVWLKTLVDDYVYKYSLLMNIEINDVRLRKMKTEWGNCNYSKKVLTFNSYLYHMSESFIEAIVVHEMAHIYVHNHSKAFYDLIHQYLPDYKKRILESKNVSLK